jgi:flagellar motor switch protein FliM
MALSCWERSWAHVAELKFKILAQESDPLIVQIVPGSEMVILVGFELHIGEVAGTMNVCIPLMNIGPLLEKLSAQLSYSSKLPRDVAAKTRAQVQDVLARVTVPVTADLGASRLFVRELLSLQEGDILQLDNPVSGYASVRVGDKQKFYAKPGRVGDESAVQIVSSIE